MNVASPDVCRELHQLSGWKQTFFCHYFGCVRIWIPAFSNEPPYDNGDFEAVPAYDLGYLLRKLPETVNDYYDFYLNHHEAFYGDLSELTGHDTLFVEEADTPENAVAKLCCELIRQGVLKP